ncbi:MAG: N-formylglutamate deformylase [Pseudomonadota bacterium]
MEPVTVRRGDSPVVLGVPHAGTWLPDEIRSMLNDQGRLLADTDWHVDRLYDGLGPDVTVVRANAHRYVIDANRDPSGASLYPGQNSTDLVPQTDFDGRPIWDLAPDAAEIAARIQRWHAPYHAALRAELERVRGVHGIAVLYDCHSIRSHAPYLFEGRLPDFNIGTNRGATCDALFENAVTEICRAEAGFSTVVNGRFLGGWSTRHYGRPSEGWHAIQMELAQSTYLASEKPPFAYHPTKAGRLRPTLAHILHRIDAIAREMGGHP